MENSSPQQPSQWRCTFKDDGYSTTYAIEGLPPDFFEQFQDKLTSSQSLLTVSAATKVQANADAGNALVVAEGASVDIIPADPKMMEPQGAVRRELAQLQGTNTVLMIRVVDPTGDAPTKTLEELSDDILGTSGDVMNLVSSYSH